MKWFPAIVAICLGASISLSAQTVTYTDDFQSYGTQANPPGWVDSAVGTPAPEADGLFKTWPDPTQGNRGSNVVFGSKSGSGKPDQTPRIGRFSTLTSHTFDARGRFELRGRFIRTHRDARLGFTVLSSYPEADSYYLVGLWDAADALTMQLFAADGRPFEGEIDSSFTPEINRWYRMLIRVDSFDGTTRVQARFWTDGEEEPDSFVIDARDASAERLTSGRLGVWGAVRGEIYVDELFGKSPVDFTAPVITVRDGDDALPSGVHRNRTVVPVISVVDDIDPSPQVTGTLNGSAFTSGTPVEAEGDYLLHVTAVDDAGNSAETQVAFTVDRTPPVVTITTPLDGALFTGNIVEVTGTIDDADTLRLNGRDAERDLETGTWRLAVELGEGSATLEALGTDRAGNEGRASIGVAIDSRSPLLTITAPSSESCLGDALVQIAGRVIEPHLERLTVSTGSASVAATVTADGLWSAAFAGLPEGEHRFTVEALDRLNHRSVALVKVRVDRTPPSISVSTGDRPLANRAVFARSIAPVITTGDLDPSPRVTTTLDGQPYAPGATIDAEGNHTLVVRAVDCAGHESTTTLTFTIDRTPPEFESFDPAIGSELREIPAALRARVSTDTAVVRLRGTDRTAQVGTDGWFAFSGLDWKEGTNRFTFEAEDRAGHTAEASWNGILDREAPHVAITIDGTPLTDGTTFARAVSPVIVVDDTSADVTATLNGAAFTSGSSVSSEGAHQIRAIATDRAGNTTELQRRFTIDRSAPSIAIDAPAQGFSAEAESVTVSGTASKAVRVRINGREVPLGSGRFSGSVLLEYGENDIIVEAFAASGTSARAIVSGTRVHPTGIVITHPLDGLLTNRPHTRVTGMVFDASGSAVTVAGRQLTTDSSGAFVLHELPLEEGENVITASVTRNGVTRSTDVRVRADRTPPAAAILAGGTELSDDSQFASATELSVTASDASQPLSLRLLLNGVETAAPVSVATNGMHRVQLIARDAAGNETWIERSFRIGEGAVSGCTLSGLDPADGSTVTTTSTMITGRTGAQRVLVNGVEASVRSGTFLGSVDLEREGANVIRIACVDGAGNEIESTDLTLHRSTGLPTIAILDPAELHTAAAERVAVTLRAGGGAVRVVVNGVARPLEGDPATERQITIADVPLSNGLNIISASAYDSAGRAVTATRRVIRRVVPGSVSIVNPLPGMVIGGRSLRASGLWRDVDPSSIRATLDGAPLTLQVEDRGATAGSWTLESSVTAGAHTLRIEASSWNGTTVHADSTFDVSDSAAAILIDSPAPIAWLPQTSTDVPVRGSVAPAEGVRVDVNGTSAVVSGERFEGSVTLREGANMIVARAAAPNGSESADAVLVHRLPALAVREIFPANGASGVDPATVMLVLLSSPVDASSASSAVQLTDAAGAQVPVVVRVDRDTIAAAPTTTLRSGERYTLTIGTALRDLAGQALPQAVTSTFDVLGSAPSSAPVLDEITPVCGTAPVLTGTTTPGARLKIVLGELQLSAAADATGRFTATLPVTGEGWQVVRVSATGSDGSVSPSAEISFLVDCAPLSVLSSSFDRGSGIISIVFSKGIDRSSLASSIAVTADGAAVTWSERTFTGDHLEIALPTALEGTVALRISTSLSGSDGSRLSSPYERTFAATEEEQPRAGRGWIRGEVFDASTGRPLGGVRVVVERSAFAFNDGGRLTALQSGAVVAGEAISDDRGRYSIVVDEGPWTLHFTRDGYAPAWRAVVAPAGAGTQPIDVRLARSAPAVSQETGSVVSDDAGGDAPRIELELAAASGSNVSLSSLPLQSLPGLLPLGWSPIAAAWIDADALTSATLVWSVADEPIISGVREPVLVRFAPERNEWITVALAHERRDASPIATPIDRAGGWALALPDAAPRSIPPPAVVGAPLQGVPAAPDVIAPASLRFSLDPPVILPTESSLASLEVDTTTEALFPSGTAVEAQVDEVLMLADGGVVTDLPFATDVLLYHSADGATAHASFRLAPSDRAREVMLREGAEHIRIVPYAGRVDRGTLVGPEGGAVAGSPELVVEIPAGALDRSTRASVVPMNDVATTYPLHGYVVHRGFELRLEDTSGTPTEEGEPAAPRLFRPARLVTTLNDSSVDQLLIVRIEQPQWPNFVSSAPRDVATLVARTTIIDQSRFTTLDVTADALALSGIDREGRYLVVSPVVPVAFAAGTVVTTTADPLAGALVDTPFTDGAPMGVVSVTSSSGRIAIPVRSGDPFHLDAVARGAARARIWTHDRSTAAGEIVILEQPMTWDGRPLTVVGVRLIEGATTRELSSETADVSTSATFEILFDGALETAQQIPVRLIDLSNGTSVSISAAVQGERVLVTPTSGMPPAATLQLTVERGVRAASGALLGRSHSWRLRTAASSGEAAIDASKIRITIPENGVSTITALPGALPPRWLAVASRPAREFITIPQAMAGTDGSLTITAGSSAGPDHIDLSDRLHLRILNEDGALAAVLPLGPFVSPDGLAFVALPGEQATYETPEGVRLTVPANAFDEPVIVRAEKNVEAQELTIVPSFETELTLIESVRISLECQGARLRACEPRTRLELSLSSSKPTDSSQGPLLLGWVGRSSRGPRIMIVDTLVESESGLATGESVVAQQSNGRLHSTSSSGLVRPHLQGVTRSGVYALLDLNTADPYGFAIVAVPVGVVDLFFTQDSLFATHLHRFESGRLAVPVVQGQPFSIEGVDASGGFTLFRREYAPLPLPPGGVEEVADASPDLSGPYPVDSSVARIDSILLNTQLFERQRYTAHYADQRLRADFFGAGRRAQLLLPALGRAGSTTLTDGWGSLSLDSVPAHSLAVVVLPGQEVAGDVPVWIRFNEPIDGESLASGVIVRSTSVNASSSLQAPDVTALFDVHLDDSGRTLLVRPTTGLLVPSTRYVVELTEHLTDAKGNPIGIGQSHLGEPAQIGSPQPVVIEFQTRTALDEIASFSLRPSQLEATGNLRDLAQVGNVAFVAAGSAGLLAYDLSDPSALIGSGGDPLPMALVPADRHVQNADGSTTVTRRGLKQHTAVAADRHGRVVTAGITDTFAVLRTYGLDDFLAASSTATCEPNLDAPANSLCRFRGSSIVGWAPGYSSSLGDTTLLSDRAEGLPRRVRVLSQDDERSYTAESLRDSFAVQTRRTYAGGFEEIDVAFEYTPLDPATSYAFQRVTIENIDLDMRWSADVLANTPDQYVRGVLVRAGDRLRVVRNQTTWVVVTLFGHGALVYDLNAIESNDRSDRPDGFDNVREQLVEGRIDDACATVSLFGECDADLSLTPEIVPVPELDASVMLYGPEVRKGIAAAGVSPHEKGVTLEGLPLYPIHDGRAFVDSRLTALALEASAVGVTIRPRMIGAEQVRIAGKKYLLIAADRLGLLAFDVDTRPLSEASLAGVLWVPSGVVGVRGIPGTSLVSLVDNSGRLLVADISLIDERDYVGPGEMFPTALRALRSGSSTPGGVDDPRIVWRSREGLVSGTIPPLVDPSSGLIFGGSSGTAEMKLGLAFEPRLRVLANLGRATLTEIDSIVPLGIAPPSGWLTGSAEASAAAFRVETTLPARSAGAAEIELMVESEVVEESRALETPDSLPRAHLRSDGQRPARVVLRSSIPQGSTPEETAAIAKKLRHQRGANRFASSWIVALADPRASEQFAWGSVSPEEKGSLGCEACDRPASLQGRDEPSGVHELFSAGRLFSLSARLPENLQTSFGSALQTRVRTIPADTIRIPEVQVAGQDPPLAGGAIQGSIYAHSGELEVPAVDLDAGGRAGWNVIIDRTYRSRSIGITPLGFGWTSSMFRRLRELPNGDVEYRDEAGETWRFRGNRLGYNNVRGLMLHLTRGLEGWTLVDPLQRRMVFDDYGRLIQESDHFWKPSLDGKEYGNATQYVYGRDGRLQLIVDAVGRETQLFYYESGPDRGLLREVRDWRGRSVEYAYEDGRLVEVRLPEVEAAPGVPEQYSHTGANRPRIRYAYEPLPSTYTDRVDLGANLISITDPNEVAHGGPARVTWTYGPAADTGKRDRITEEIWPCGTTAGGGCREATATLDWGVNLHLTDILGQRTMYRTAEGPDGRKHIDEMKMFAVPTVEFAAGAMPNAAPVEVTPELRDLITRVESRTTFGQVQTRVHPDGSREEITFEIGSGGGMRFPRALSSSWQGADGETQVTSIGYDEETNARHIPSSISRGDSVRPMSAAHRDRPMVERQDDDFTQRTVVAPDGLTIEQSVSIPGGEAIAGGVDHYPASDHVKLRRALPQQMTRGGAVITTFRYEAVGDGMRQVREDSETGTVAVERRDAWGRVVETRLEQDGKRLRHERYGYDAAGNLGFTASYQSGPGWVETRHDYDPLGRRSSSRVNHAVVDGEQAEIRTWSQWDLAERKTIDSIPNSAPVGDGTVTRHLDGLGREVRTVTVSGDSASWTRSVTAYDSFGRPAWTSDAARAAAAVRFDSLGRARELVRADGTRSTLEYDVWGQLIAQESSSASGERLARSESRYTRLGMLRSTNEVIGRFDYPDPLVRQTRFAIAPSETGTMVRSTRVGAVDRIDSERILPDAAVQLFEELRDSRGRVIRERLGKASGSVGDVVGDFAGETIFGDFVGETPRAVITLEPRVNVAYTSTLEVDALGRTTSSLAPGGYLAQSAYDEAGNPLSITAPGMSASQASYDSRGLPLAQVHPDGARIELHYDAQGAVTLYRDETDSETRYTTDGLGRATKVEYPDGTWEETRYELGTGLVARTRDRAGVWLSYSYGPEGRLEGVYEGETIEAANQIIRYEYDDAARLVRVSNAESAIQFAGFDGLGRPTISRTYLFSNASGLSSSPEVRERYVQTREWNAHDEVSRFSLPVPGESADNVLPAPWRTWIAQSWDAGGNLIQQQAASSRLGAPEGEIVARSEARSAGRLSERVRGPLRTSYLYDDGREWPQDLPRVAEPRTSGALLAAAFEVSGRVIAGGSVDYDETVRLEDRFDLGVQRVSGWNYDTRGRLASSVILLPDDASLLPIDISATDADFLNGRTVPDAFTADELERLGSAAAAIQRASWMASESAAHQIEMLTLPDEVRGFQWDGGRRISDSVWRSEYDSLGRMIGIESEAAGRRIQYAYDPMNRLVARTALGRTDDGGWSIEQRTNVLARDGLPAQTTWLWDPITDRLLAVYASGEESGDSNPASRLLRQYIHGDRGYDDPVEVLIATNPGGTPQRLYPIIDEAGSGSVDALVDESGNLVERVLYADAFGDAPRYLHGPVIDRIAVEADTGSDGSISEVRLVVHASERLDGGVVRGLRIRGMSSDGSVRQTSEETIVDPADPHTAVMTIAWRQWLELTTDAETLEIVVLDSLRSPTWAHAPPMPAPEWTRILRNVRSAAGEPIIITESRASFEARLATTTAGETVEFFLYEIPDLYLAASAESRSNLLTNFKTAPLIEPATGAVYLRDRWYDPATASFVTPDALQYRDSSVLYAYCAADPVNCSDPTGLARRTAKGGVNYLGDISNGFVGDTWWSRALGVGADTVGNTLSDVLMLDLVADSSIILGDSTFSGSQRAIAGGKLVGITAFNIAGGEILGTAGKVLLKIPGANRVVARFAKSGAGKVLAADVGELVTRMLSAVDDLSLRISPLADDQLGFTIPRIVMNQLSGEGAEETAKATARRMGETVIETQFQRGAALRGFDFLSFTGSGREAQLFINEVKLYTGRVGSRRFTTFGLGRSGMRTFDEAYRVARARIQASSLDDLTRRTLIRQLDARTARIRLIGGRSTIFDPRILERIGQRTGFLTGQGFALP